MKLSTAAKFLLAISGIKSAYEIADNNDGTCTYTIPDVATACIDWKIKADSICDQLEADTSSKAFVCTKNSKMIMSMFCDEGFAQVNERGEAQMTVSCQL